MTAPKFFHVEQINWTLLLCIPSPTVIETFFESADEEKNICSSWRRAADFCAACRGSAEAEAHRKTSRHGSIGVEGAHRRAPRWRGPQARRMACSRYQLARALRPHPRRKTHAGRHRRTATALSCWAALASAKLPL